MYPMMQYNRRYTYRALQVPVLSKVEAAVCQLHALIRTEHGSAGQGCSITRARGSYLRQARVETHCEVLSVRLNRKHYHRGYKESRIINDIALAR